MILWDVVRHRQLHRGLRCLVRDLCACRGAGREFVVVILVD